MPRTIIYHAHIVNPETDDDFIGGIIFENGIITHIFKGDLDSVTVTDTDIKIDAVGKVLTTGLCDLFVGVGEPTGRNRESFASLSRAALSGGITHILIDPDTSPVLDSPSVVDYAIKRAALSGHTHISVAGAMTKDLENKEMAQMGLLRDCGVRTVTVGDYAVQDTLLMHRIMSYGRNEDMIISVYPDDVSLSGNGISHDGFVSTLYGLSPVPEISEQIGLRRDIMLAQDTGCKIHIRGISSAKSLPMIEQAKNDGVDITVSVSAQHLSLNEYDIIPYKTFLKMRPPLRTEQDRTALVDAVASGLIDMVISQHRPRASDLKRLPYQDADVGCSGVETLLSVMLELYHNSTMSLCDALKPISHNSAKRFGLHHHGLKVGNAADFIMIDINQSYRIERDKMLSASTNTAFEGRIFQGKCTHVFIKGECVYEH